MPFPAVLKCVHTLANSDLCVVGCHLGFDWNQVCKQLQKAGLQGQDGNGAITLYRRREPYAQAEVEAIVTALFDHHPTVNEICVIDDF